MLILARSLYGWIFIGLLVALVADSIFAIDYYPEHPTVQEMVEKGVQFLEKPQEGQQGSGFDLGEQMLQALAVYKVRADAGHPNVQRGIKTAIRLTEAIARNNYQISGEKIVYEAAVAAILLASVDVDGHRDHCLMLRDFFQRVQRPYGAYGYLEGPSNSTGDTSMTQYAMLAIWTLDQVGIEFDEDRIEPMLRWLQQTQDPSGAWGYQGKVSQGPLVPQEEVRHSLAAAGLGSLLIGGDFLGFYRNRRAEAEEDYIPKAFRRVIEKPEGESRRKNVSIQKEDIDGTVQRGVRWFNEHPYTRIPTWHYYYLYSEERMYAFLEISSGKQQKSPSWYNRGVEMLKRSQAPNGGWGVTDPEYMSAQVSTAFAVLYLIRSTQKAIGALNEGMMRGGYELPKDLSNVEDVDGKFIDRSKMNTLDEVLGLLESEDASKNSDVVVSDQMKLEKDPKRRKEQLNRLARLLSSKDHRARRTAAKLLGRGDDLDLVPMLIYALGDGDKEVCKQAETSLRIISRRLDTRLLPEIDDRQYSDVEKKKAIDGWKAWYRTIRPEYAFAD